MKSKVHKTADGVDYIQQLHITIFYYCNRLLFHLRNKVPLNTDKDSD